MPELPILKPREVITALEKMGYKQHRQKGSHLIMIRDGSIHQPVIPMHAKDLKKGTLRSVIRQCGITVDEFLKYLD